MSSMPQSCEFWDLETLTRAAHWEELRANWYADQAWTDLAEQCLGLSKYYRKLAKQRVQEIEQCQVAA